MKSLFRWSFLVCVSTLSDVLASEDLHDCSDHTMLLQSWISLSRASLATVNAWQVAGCKARARKLRIGETGEIWRDWLILKCVNNINHRRSQSETRYKKRMKRYKLYKLALWDILSILSRCHVRFWSSRLWRHPGRALLWQQTFEALQAKASEHEIHEVLSIGPGSEDKSWKTLMFKNLWCFDM